MVDFITHWDNLRWEGIHVGIALIDVLIQMIIGPRAVETTQLNDLLEWGVEEKGWSLLLVFPITVDITSTPCVTVSHSLGRNAIRVVLIKNHCAIIFSCIVSRCRRFIRDLFLGLSAEWEGGTILLGAAWSCPQIIKPQMHHHHHHQNSHVSWESTQLVSSI